MAKIDYSGFDIEIEKSVDYREDFDPKTTPHIIEQHIQRTVDDIINQCPDVDWNENLITYRIINCIREILSNYKIPGFDEDFVENTFQVEAYKLTGSAENFHGDIAFVITRRFSEHSNPISGVAFYEAKASNNNQYSRNEYPSFCTNQLKRLVTHTPRLNYLIYSKNGCHIGNSDWPNTDELNRDLWKSNYSNVNAAVIDANFLKKNRNIDFALRTIGLSFGSHFVRRVLSGRDLDYSRTVDKTIRRWLKYTRKSSPIIITVSILDNHGEHFCSQLALPGFERVSLENHIQALTRKITYKEN
ncbi:hypothetical protein ACPV3P_06510 [Photobacterium damselae]|uniref:hypothetical protein n=1 Tax=Photobacterium damselae TaxID=38293 RepID=UPI001EE03C95|nr:hypothetical protein [Photobacterium damselae]MCG3816357.1 hypothetical protein [Photobacterium damselae]